MHEWKFSMRSSRRYNKYRSNRWGLYLNHMLLSTLSSESWLMVRCSIGVSKWVSESPSVSELYVRCRFIFLRAAYPMASLWDVNVWPPLAVIPSAGEAERLLALGIRVSLKKLRCNAEWWTGSLVCSAPVRRLEDELTVVSVVRDVELGIGLRALAAADKVVVKVIMAFESHDPTPLESVL